MTDPDSKTSSSLSRDTSRRRNVHLSKQCTFSLHTMSPKSSGHTFRLGKSRASCESQIKGASTGRKLSHESTYSSTKFSEFSENPTFSRFLSEQSSYASNLSTSRATSKPSTFYRNFSTHSSSYKPSSLFPKHSVKSSSMYNRAVSSKRSCFSSATVKPSFFSNSLESFAKQSIYARDSKAIEAINLAELDIFKDQADSALGNWDRWLDIHHQQQEDLSRKLNRPVQCMAMNTSADQLYTNQDKRDISEAAGLVKVDKFRGHPNFWKPDDAVENKRLGVYQTIQQKYDRSRQNFYPQLQKPEYIGVPDAILSEQGVLGKPCLPTIKEKWENSPDVSAKKLELHQELKVIQEHQPDISEVAIVGVGLDRPWNRSPARSRGSAEGSTKQFSYESTKTMEFDDTVKVHKTSLVSVVVEDEEMLVGSSPWLIYFDDCYVNDTYTKRMDITNSEDSCLKYSWEIILPPWVKSDLPLIQTKSRKQCFYFNKTPGAVLPGDRTTISFIFKPSIPGVFSEKWELVMSLQPDQWETATVELIGVAVENSDYKESLNKIDAYIEACTRYTMARKALQEMLDRERYHERSGQLPYDWNFSEEQIFIFNNPNLFYDNKCVYKLKSLHEKICVGPWDYSAENLRQGLLNELKNKDIGEEIALLTSIVVQLMKPTSTTAFSSEKHKTVYELLCCFVSNLESDGANLKISLNIPLIPVPNIEKESDNNHSGKLTKSTNKISPRPSEMSKKSSRKSLLRTKYSIKISSTSSLQSEGGDQARLHSIATGQSESYLSENTMKRKKQEYLDALFVKTFNNLSKTVDNIVAALESFDVWNKKTALKALKEGTIK